jgi:hypothetical protein
MEEENDESQMAWHTSCVGVPNSRHGFSSGPNRLTSAATAGPGTAGGP